MYVRLTQYLVVNPNHVVLVEPIDDWDSASGTYVWLVTGRVLTLDAPLHDVLDRLAAL